MVHITRAQALPESAIPCCKKPSKAMTSKGQITSQGVELVVLSKACPDSSRRAPGVSHDHMHLQLFAQRLAAFSELQLKARSPF